MRARSSSPTHSPEVAAALAAALAQQLGAQEGGGHRGPADVWLGVNRGSFALWLAGLAVFGIVGLWGPGLNTLKIIGW